MVSKFCNTRVPFHVLHNLFPFLSYSNLSRLGTILDLLKTYYGQEIPGITSPFLYFGSWKTSFALHTEDMELYSISYHHMGDPKTWYSVPPKHGHRFEELASLKFPDLRKACPAFLRYIFLKTFFVYERLLILTIEHLKAQEDHNSSQSPERKRNSV